MSKPEIRGNAGLSTAAYAGMFVFGIVMALLGAILPSLAGRLRFSTADIGTLFLVMNACMLLCSLVLGLAMDRFGMKPPLALGPLAVAAALALVVRAEAFGDLIPAVVLLGVGGGAVNGASNTLVADLHDDPRRKNAALNLLGIFFGFGALFLPFTIGALLAEFSVMPLLIAAALLCAGAGLFAGALRFPPPKQRNALPVAEMPRFLRSPLVLTFALLLFFESGVEFTLGGFISTYLVQDLGVSSVSMASWTLAGYWASIMLSRAVLSRLALDTDPYRTLGFSAVGAFVGALLAAVAPSAGVAAFALVLTGWSLAGVYPAVLGIAGARFQSHSGTVFGILFTVALSGGMILPWSAGRIGGALGLRWAFGMIAASFAVIFLLGRVGATSTEVDAAR
ncbi:MAG TPA: MFS transporter [Bryobacteraceae bacterium]|nr:MFS transporter [Bryobacteraceae bacterium]